jgi:hypothetical protein
MLNVFILSVVRLNVIMLSFVTLNVVMLSVVAPYGATALSITTINAYAECHDAGCRNKLNLKSIVMLSVKAFQE